MGGAEFDGVGLRGFLCRTQTVGKTAKARAQKQNPQSIQFSPRISLRSDAESPKRKPRNKTKNSSDRADPVRSVAQRSCLLSNSESMPRPTNHHAGRQKIGKTRARQLSSKNPVGTHDTRHVVGSEISTSTIIPGRLRPVIM